MAVEIQILSDLHLEAPSAYDIFEVPPSAPYLALLGDIGNTRDAGLAEFLERMLRGFRVVLFLLGNHEPYHSSWKDSREQLQKFKADMDEKRSFEPTLGTFIILDQTRYDLSDSVTILGCPLFSKVTHEQNHSVSFGLNDFFHIQDWTVEGHNEAHTADLNWLNEQVDTIERTEPGRQIIVLTHHAPTTDPRVVDPRHASSPISSGFRTDLSQEKAMRSANVKVWAYGHTHFNSDFVLANTGTRLVANQRGYYFAQASGKEFQHSKTITI